ncbi:MAG: hypothetical protein NTY45_09995, partial [Elusimicrobia bacterium]|nr:hypothetical protein [Elusimicrobiota bacterium]
MKNSLLFMFLFFPAFAFAGSDPEPLPGVDEVKTAAPEAPAVIQRPDAQKIMTEITQALKLSSRQEDRIAKAVNRKTGDFDDSMAKYEKYSAEEKKWRAKMEENRLAMEKINRDMPDLIREYLDEEQRQAYDDLLAAKNKPAAAAEEPAAGPAVEPAAAGDPAAPARKKKRIIRRKKAGPAGALPPGAPAAAEAAAPAAPAAAAAATTA